MPKESENYKIISSDENKYGYANAEDTIVIPCIYDDAKEFQKNIAQVELDGRIFYIDCNGHELFELADNGWHKLERVVRNGKYSFININKSRLICDFVYDAATPFRFCDQDFDFDSDVYTAIAAVKQNGKWGLIGGSGNIKVPLIYDEIALPDGDCFYAKKDGHYGFINLRNKVLLPFIYDDVQYVDLKGTFYVKKEGKRGIVREGKEIQPCIYDYITKVTYDAFIVKKDGKYGVIKENVTIVPLIYDDLSHTCNDDIYIVEKDDKYGVVCKDKEIHQCIYDEIYEHRPYYYLLVSNHKRGIAYQEDIVVPLIYDELQSTGSKDIYIAQKDGKWGIVSLEKEILPCIYDYITEIYCNNVKEDEDTDCFWRHRVSEPQGYYFIVGSNDKYGIANEDGIFVPLKYKLAYLEKKLYQIYQITL